jgi:small subunit ribosomal protein S7
MSRRKRVYHKIVRFDSIYGSAEIAKFINKIMLDGKKSKAETIVYSALQILGEKSGIEPDKAFEQVLKNVAPIMEVKSRRVGGSTYQVPIEVKRDRAHALAMRWLIGNARGKSGPMGKNLANEFVDAFNKVGASIKKREDTHKMAEANKAFAHFRW